MSVRLAAALTSAAAAAALAACTIEPNVAPVSYGMDRATISRAPVAEGDRVEARAYGGRVRVEEGDTVYSLARRFGAQVGDIAAANDLDSDYTISPGQDLYIPSAEESSSRASVSASAPEPAIEVKRLTLAEGDDAPSRFAFARPQTSPQASAYTVRKGDTLYSIARARGVDVDRLAGVNNLAPPYQILPGQTLRFPTGAAPVRIAVPGKPAPEPEKAKAAAKNAGLQVERDDGGAIKIVETSTTKAGFSLPGRPRFAWPLDGDVISAFGPKSNGRRNEGINIAAPQGTAVRAAADGVVAYRGSEIKGYGNLLLIRHKNDWITAYAHAKNIKVELGERVSQGQVVAEVGATGSVIRPQLHFEIRKDLNAVDPVRILKD